MINWDKIISVQEAVKITGRAKETLIGNIKNGVFKENIDCKKIGNSWRFDRDVVEEYYRNIDRHKNNIL